MKFATVLTALAMTFAATHAAECTMEDQMAWASKPELLKIATACSGMATTGATTDAEALKKFCAMPDCVSALKALAAVAPKCTVSGQSPTAAYDAITDACKGTTSAATTSGASSAITAAAVATVVLAYARV